MDCIELSKFYDDQLCLFIYTQTKSMSSVSGYKTFYTIELHKISWILAFSSFLQTNECKESVAATATTVLSCPSNAKKWDERSLKKGCSQIKHTCSSFEYHCVVNSWLNETIEVCASKRIIVGKKQSYFLSKICLQIVIKVCLRLFLQRNSHISRKSMCWI